MGAKLEVTTPLGSTRGTWVVPQQDVYRQRERPQTLAVVVGTIEGEEMNVVWSATSPETRRVGFVMRTEFQELEARFIELRSIGGGYLEVMLPTENSPQVTLGFRGDHAVVEQLADLDEDPKSFLLVGDGSLSPTSKVEVPFMDDDAGFSGDFVMSVDRGWGAVRAFVHAGSVVDLGEWYEL